MSAFMTHAGNIASSESSGAWGAVTMILTVIGSGAWTSLMALYGSFQTLRWPARARSSETLTSFDVSGVPSENLTPGRRLNVQVNPSADVSHLVASAGSTAAPSLVTRSKPS